MINLKDLILGNKFLFGSAVVLLVTAITLYILNIPGDLLFILFALITLLTRVASRTLFQLAVFFLVGVFITLVAIGEQNRLSLSLASYSFILLMAGVLAGVIEQWFEIRAITK